MRSTLLRLLFPTVVLAPLALSAATAPIVPGFERFGRQPDTNLREAGELLLGELNCTRCHQAEGDAAQRLAATTGPTLEAVGDRVRPDYLRRWLAAPHEVKPGTKMPDALAGLSAAERPKVVEALTHYLASLHGKDDAKTQPGSAERGRHLFHQIGCIACHAPDKDFVPETAPGVQVPKVELPSVPLGQLGEKYTVASLQRFLLDPLSVRPGARMPQIPMAAEEAADLAAYLTGLTGDAASPQPFQPDAALVAQGREHFTTLGCAACHSAPDQKAKPAQPLAALAKATTRGCLADQPGAHVPHYELDAAQRTALRAALEKLAEPQSLTPAQSAQRAMTSLNCYACHVRDQRGGPEPGRAAYFKTVDDVDLGDEGRLPPALTGVGAKLQTEAIDRTVRGQGAVRPYMATRMPNFGADHAAEFARLFTAADYKPLTKPFPSEKGVGRNTVGREIVGTTGVACIACHGLAGKKSLGVPAIDLANAPKRLRREWFHSYLLDPGKLRPGTRMPSFWPGGKPANPKLKGSTEHQIDSIWVYLTEIDQSRLPEGMMDKGEFELKPSGEPIVFRTFMKDVGMQAIAVGFPEKIHAAFDSKTSRWAVAWRGAFLDAEGTWEERAAPLAEPLSKDTTKLAEHAQFLSASPAPGSPPQPQFRGYRFDKHGVPTFLYRLGATDIEDRVEPASGGRALRRTITLRGNAPLTFQPAPHEKLVTGAANFAGGEATLTTEISW